MKTTYEAQIHVIPNVGKPYWLVIGTADTEEEAKAMVKRSVEMNKNFCAIDRIRVLYKYWKVITEEAVNNGKAVQS